MIKYKNKNHGATLITAFLQRRECIAVFICFLLLALYDLSCSSHEEAEVEVEVYLELNLGEIVRKLGKLAWQAQSVSIFA